MKLFNIESPLMRFLTKCGDLILLNLLWAICCIPIITIGASTTAMYGCLLNSSTESSTTVKFFSYFKSNFLKSTVLFFVKVVAVLFVYTNIRFYINYLDNSPYVLRAIIMSPSILILSTLSYIYPLQSHFENKISQTLKNSIKISIANFPISLIITAINLLPIIIVLIDLKTFLNLVLLFTMMGGSTISYINSFLLKKVFDKYTKA